jgi:CHASE2 domain-containing sensor protein
MSVLIGLLLEVAALNLPFPALKFTRQAADDMADVMMRMSALSQASPEAASRFAFINIDDATWIAWGAPLITPRNKIATLLARVVESKPAVIILDIDLAFRDEVNSENILKSFLSSYPADAAPLVLVRNFEPAANAIHSELRPTQYEQQTQQTNVYWALPSFERDDDGMVRRWQLAAVTCAAAAPVTVPSVQLQAAWLWLGKKNELLRTPLARLRPENCDVPAPDVRVKIDLGSDGHAIEINSNDPSSRIVYTIPWVPDAMVQGPLMPDGNFKVVVRNADTVSRIQPGNGIPGIAGTIAIIGGSFHDGGDWYRTPLGQMPGALVLINSIDALAEHGTPKEPAVMKQFGLSLVFIVFVSLCVGVFRAAVAALLSLAVIGGLMLVTMPMFRSGIIFSLAIPSLGILVADFLLSLLHDIDVIRQIGWRWILRPVTATDKAHGE